MPIPAPQIYRPSNLTQEQRQEQLAAVYGVEMNQFTPEEVERMRSIVSGYDQAKPVETHDLNNPPRQPYRFQKFPKMVYDLSTGKNHTVRSEEELADAIADGWSEEPPVAVEAEQEQHLSPKYQREAEAKQAEIDAIKRDRMAAARAAKAQKANQAA